METLRFYDDNHFYKSLLSAIVIVTAKLEEISKREQALKAFNKNALSNWFTQYEKNETDKLKVDDMISKIIYMEKYYKIYQKMKNKKVLENW